MLMSIANAAERPLHALPRHRLIDRASEAIKDHILANRLSTGDRLPSELDLARSLGNRFLETMGTILYRFFWNVVYSGPAINHVSDEHMKDSHIRVVEKMRQRCLDDVPAIVALHLGVEWGAVPC